MSKKRGEITVPTRMGDGQLVRMTRSEIRRDVEAGSEQASIRAKVDPLSENEVEHIVDIYASSARFCAVDLGDEVVLSADQGGMKTHSTRLQDALAYEQWMGSDLVEYSVVDDSVKVVRTILPYEAQRVHDALLDITVPVQYGVMPNLGLYSKPDGPIENWSELLPECRIDEARAAQEEATEMATVDLVHLADAMYEAGADGMDFDTVGASGDGDFLATLLATEAIRRRYPTLGVMVGMAGEVVLGMHGTLTYGGTRLAGLWPWQQLELVQQAGATMFGPVVNVDTRRSCAWNIAKTIALVKPCMQLANIPIHLNLGMGVGGAPMFVYPSVDAVSRAAKAAIELLRLDGL